MALKAEDALAIAMKYTDEHGGGGGTSDYTSLKNKPQINNVTLTGNKTTEDLIPIGNGLNFNEDGELEVTGSETTYDDLQGKPKINNVELSGNKTSTDLGLMSEYDIDDTPTESSENLISSGAVWEADKNIKDMLQGTKTVTGNPITITDAEPINAESVIVELEPIQDLHGYDKPWVGGAGKNKYNMNNVNDSLATHTVFGDSMTINVVSPRGKVVFENPFGTETGKIVTLSLDIDSITNPENLPAFFGFVTDNPRRYITISDLNTTGHKSVTINLGENEHISSVDFCINDSNTTPSSNVSYTISHIQVEEGSTATTFEPYSNICPITGYSEVNVENNTDTYTIDLDGTKYGGTLDVTEGGYSDEWGYISGSSISDLQTWATSAGITLEINTTASDILAISFNGITNGVNNQTVVSDNQLLCNTLDRDTAENQYHYNETRIAVNDSGSVIFKVKDITTQADMDTWLSNNPIQIAYRKKTPSSISTTPTQIQMLENTNNISTNGTNIQLKYQPNNIIGECKKFTVDEIAKLGLPKPPMTDGTYHLECSISEGVPTIRWVVNSGE